MASKLKLDRPARKKEKTPNYNSGNVKRERDRDSVAESKISSVWQSYPRCTAEGPTRM